MKGILYGVGTLLVIPQTLTKQQLIPTGMGGILLRNIIFLFDILSGWEKLVKMSL